MMEIKLNCCKGKLAYPKNILKDMRYRHNSKSLKTDDDTQDDTTPARPPCYGPYRWQLCGEGGKYVVCDAHLAMAIRKCDLPARIDRPLDGEDVMSVKFLSKRNPLPKP
ncbi:MAG: hypothetical protein EBZ49_01525 [Proteobacteria bacterium]|nr:hypothetical protein [Pseudomonadota bacterium]